MHKDLATKLGLEGEVRTILPVSSFDIEHWEFHDWGPRTMRRVRNASATSVLLVGVVGLMYELPWSFFAYCFGFAVFAWLIFEIRRRGDVQKAKADRRRFLDSLGFEDIDVADVTSNGDENKPYIMVPRVLN